MTNAFVLLSTIVYNEHLLIILIEYLGKDYALVFLSAISHVPYLDLRNVLYRKPKQLDPIPSKLLHYKEQHRDSSWYKSISKSIYNLPEAACDGNITGLLWLRMFDFLYNNNTSLTTSVVTHTEWIHNITVQAAKYGQCHILEWILHENPYYKFDNIYCYDAVVMGHLHMVSYLRDKGVSWENAETEGDLFNKIVEIGNMDTLIFLHEQNYIINKYSSYTKNPCVTAAKYQQWGILCWLKSQGFKLNKKTLEEICGHGNIDMLDWFLSENIFGIVVDMACYDKAAERCQYNIFQWLLKQSYWSIDDNNDLELTKDEKELQNFIISSSLIKFIRTIPDLVIQYQLLLECIGKLPKDHPLLSLQQAKLILYRIHYCIMSCMKYNLDEEYICKNMLIRIITTSIDLSTILNALQNIENNLDIFKTYFDIDNKPIQYTYISKDGCYIKNITNLPITTFEYMSPYQSHMNINELIRKFREDSTNGEIIHDLVLYGQNVELFPGKILSRFDLLEECIKLNPLNGEYYARYILWMSTDTVMIEGIERDKEWLLAKAIELSPNKVITLHAEAIIKKDTPREMELNALCFDICGGYSKVHLYPATAGCTLDNNLNIIQMTETINILLRMNLQGDVSDNYLLYSKEHFSRYYGNYKSFYQETITDMMFELSCKLPSWQYVIIDNQKMFSTTLKRVAMTIFGKRPLGKRIYLVKGVDNGRDAWYYVLVTGCIKNFLSELGNQIIHLENHGIIIKSAYGKDPPPDVTKEIKSEYCIALDVTQDISQNLPQSTDTEQLP